MAANFIVNRPRTSTRQRIVSTLAVAVLLVLSGVGLALWHFGPEDFVSIGSNDLAPGIHKGDGVVITNSGKLSTGDIISYHGTQNSTAILTRRIVWVDTARGVAAVSGGQ